jgi:hypothetical protein
MAITDETPHGRSFVKGIRDTQAVRWAIGPPQQPHERGSGGRYTAKLTERGRLTTVFIST